MTASDLSHPQVSVLRFDATLDAFEQAACTLAAHLEHTALPAQVRFDAEVVFEEIATNIVRHGHADAIEVSVLATRDAVELVFSDDGDAFNPCDAPEPAPFGPLEELTLGGLGISLTRKSSERMHYERTAGRNQLTVRVARRA